MTTKFRNFQKELADLCVKYEVYLVKNDAYSSLDMYDMLASEVSGFEDYPLDALPCMFDATKENT